MKVDAEPDSVRGLIEALVGCKRVGGKLLKDYSDGIILEWASIAFENADFLQADVRYSPPSVSDIVVARHGLGGDPPMKLREVADLFNIPMSTAVSRIQIAYRLLRSMPTGPYRYLVSTMRQTVCERCQSKYPESHQHQITLTVRQSLGRTTDYEYVFCPDCAMVAQRLDTAARTANDTR